MGYWSEHGKLEPITGGIMLIALPGLLGERKNIMALTGVGNWRPVSPLQNGSSEVGRESHNKLEKMEELCVSLVLLSSRRVFVRRGENAAGPTSSDDFSHSSAGNNGGHINYVENWGNSEFWSSCGFSGGPRGRQGEGGRREREGGRDRLARLTSSRTV